MVDPYGPVVTSLGAGLPLPWTATTAYAVNDPNTTNLRSADTGLGFSKARSTADIQAALRRTQGLPWVNTVAADSAGHSFFSQSQVLPRITDDLAQRCSTPLGRATYPSSGLAVLDGSRSDCALGSDPDAVQPGIFGPGRMPTVKDAPYVENSNDSAWLTNADAPLTGYERVFGTIGTPRSMRTRGAIEDVSAMAAKGRLTVGDLQEQQYANRAPAGDRAAADLARACAALPDGTAAGSDGRAVDVSAACDVLARWDRKFDNGSRGALLFDRFWRRATAGSAAELWKVPFSPTDPVRTPAHAEHRGAARHRGARRRGGRTAGGRIAPDAPLVRTRWSCGTGSASRSAVVRSPLGVWNKTEPVWDAAAGGYTEISAGSSYIQAVGWDGSSCPVARTLLTYSQSSNPNSPHYSDQTELFSGERWVTSRFCEKDIARSPALRVVRVREHR
ncbi:hypothetical protein GCM10018966_078440 [Streptomyces yanii]